MSYFVPATTIPSPVPVEWAYNPNNKIDVFINMTPKFYCTYDRQINIISYVLEGPNKNGKFYNFVVAHFFH